jgi:pimeloyl-ACP methyl ester carboxylesterase
MPPVVFEAGFIAGVSAVQSLQDEVGKSTSTLAYSRAGLGTSDVGPEPRTARQISDDLARLLDALRIGQPAIIVGHSFGGFVARVFAHRFPGRVAGLVLIDPATEEHYEFVRASDPTRWDNFHAEVRQQYGPPPPGWVGQWNALPTSIREAQESFPLPAVPVRVLSALQPTRDEWLVQDAGMISRWVGAHEKLVASLPGATHAKIDSTDHGGILRREELLRTILELVERSRGRP